MLHVFPYSKRPNTVAANMDNHLTNNCKNKRATLLIELSNQKKKLFYNENHGKISRVLIENKLDNAYLSGFTENYIRVKVPYFQKLVNEIKTIKILNMDENGVCHAEILD
jgi:threonylcarbamoyladenosine tRNA methylthiotransferase MtaB